ncbi:MAG: PHP domain-containing protein, partial [Armatimonadota bacterium]|nr:PHP domain-containing protein [Armatimonadota bacterium]
MYAPLWCKSNHSFLEGASHPEELVRTAHELGLPALALTDRDGVYGAVEALLAAEEVGLHLVVGAQVSVCDGTHVILLAQDREGYRNLCRLLTRGRLRSQKGSSEVTW